MEPAVYARIKSELEGYGAVEERLSRAAEVTNQPYSRVRAVQRLLQRRQLRKAACSRSPQTDVFALYRSYLHMYYSRLRSAASEAGSATAVTQADPEAQASSIAAADIPFATAAHELPPAGSPCAPTTARLGPSGDGGDARHHSSSSVHQAADASAAASTDVPEPVAAALALGRPCTLLAHMAEEWNTSPYTYARRALKGLHQAAEVEMRARQQRRRSAGTSPTDHDAPDDAPAPDVGAGGLLLPSPLSATWAKQPETLLSLAPAIHQAVAACLAPVPLELVMEDVQACHDYDLEQGRYSERIKRFMGEEHEHLLEELLQAAGVEGFLTEDGQRASAVGKTPDVLLTGCPLRVLGQRVHWIDSKASFADTDDLFESWRAQFRHYHESFGLGMVVYWFGYCISPPRAPVPPELSHVRFQPCGAGVQLMLVQEEPRLLILDRFPEVRPG